MPPDDYRYYRVDEFGEFHDAEWFSAADDDDAITKVLARYPCQESHVWQRKRLVARVSPFRMDPDDPRLQRAVGERLSAFALRIKLGKECWGTPLHDRCEGDSNALEE